jgi:hypothetical protein
MKKVFISIEQYEDEYFPLKAEAIRVKHMTNKQYIDWFIETPEPHRSKILDKVKELRSIANA